MNLRVGIVGTEPGWEQLLRREGIPFAPAEIPYALDAYAVLIVGDSARRADFAAVRTFLNDGGSVLTSSTHGTTLAGLLDQRTRVSSLVPFAEPEFASIGLIDLFGAIDVPERANMLPRMDGERTAFLGRQGHGHLLVLPFDAARVLADERARTKSFYAPAPRLPFERVSAISKGELRMFIARCIELLYHRRALPFVHVWYYPEGVPSVFAFRVDADFANESAIRQLHELASSDHVPMTWFVHVEHQRSVLRMFKEMSGQEIGVHCYRHRTFHDRSPILADLRSAYAAMKEADITPRGYAAPYGTWSRALGTSIADMNFEYSSEFSFAYDDIPITPSLDGGREGVLQIPVHPVCLGSMRRHAYSAEQATAYFEMTLRRLVGARIPSFFYHHPSDGHPDILRRLFAGVREAGLPMMTMGQFAGWWKARDRLAVRAEYGNDGVILRNGGTFPEARVRISTANGEEIFVRPDGAQRLGGEGWHATPAAVPFPKDFTRARRFNHRIPLVKGLDAVMGLFKRKD